MTDPLTDPLSDDLLLAYHAAALAPEARDDVARRLAGDDAARRRLADWAAQDTALAAAYGPVADELVPERLAALVAAARRTPTAPRRAPGRARSLARILAPVAAALALLALGAAGGWLAHRPAAPTAETFARAATEAYRTYAVEVVHPVEVPASNAAHLTGWLSKRLGHPIHAPAFDRLGFRLMGGRVLPGETGAAAQFMYEDAAGKRITLYVAPKGGGGDTAFRFFHSGATRGFWWIDGALSYALVGDIGRDALRRIAVAAYDQLI